MNEDRYSLCHVPYVGGKMTLSTEEIRNRFLSKIEKTESCWRWNGSNDSDGYGQAYNGKRMIGAHRLAFMLLVGEIPNGLTIDHKCRNRKCVNPAHLQLLSRTENVMIGIGIAANNKRKIYCKYGHPFYIQTTGKRIGRRRCKECHKLEAKKSYSLKRKV